MTTLIGARWKCSNACSRGVLIRRSESCTGLWETTCVSGVYSIFDFMFMSLPDTRALARVNGPVTRTCSCVGFSCQRVFCSLIQGIRKVGVRSSVLEHYLAKVRVAGSNPAARSTICSCPNEDSGPLSGCFESIESFVENFVLVLHRSGHTCSHSEHSS